MGDFKRNSLMKYLHFLFELSLALSLFCKRPKGRNIAICKDKFILHFTLSVSFLL